MSNNQDQPNPKKPRSTRRSSPKAIFVEIDGSKGDFTRRPMSEEQIKYWRERGWLPAKPTSDEITDQESKEKEGQA